MLVREGRPYPPHGLTVDLWRHIYPQPVDLRQLITTQAAVDLRTLLADDRAHRARREAEGTDPIPQVVEWGGELYVENGHCRLARMWCAGHRHAVARVYRMP